MAKSVSRGLEMKTLVVRITKRQYEDKLLRIMDEKGFMSVSEAIRFLLEQGYSKMFPGYLDASARSADRPRSKAQQRRDEIAELVEALDGKVEGEEVVYTAFCEFEVGEVRSEEKRLPLAHLGPEYVELQYMDALGNRGREARERIEGIVAKGRAK